MKYIDLLDYVVVLARHKRFVVRFVSASLVVALILLFLVIPRWYKSTAVVVPPRQKSMLSMMSSLKSSTSSLRALGIGVQNDDIQQYQVILNSRRIKEAVINKFDLMKSYDLETMEKAIKELEDNVSIALGKEDAAVEISVFDTSPQRAADIANYYVVMLNKIYLEISISEATNNRKFLEDRYNKNIEDLKSAEEKYKQFQEKYGVYSVSDQVKSAIEVAAKLQSQIVLKEVELGILDRTTTPENENRKNIKIELDELKRQMKNMKFGAPSKDNSIQIFTPFEKAPEIGMQYLNFYREMEIQGKILEILVPLYEQSKIEEQRNIPTVLSLDVAVPAVKASKPKRMVIILIIFLASIIFAFLIALWKENLIQRRTQLNTKDVEKLNFISREFHWRNIFR
jgi:tyrosine-protein kinase Etk/Wzc